MTIGRKRPQTPRNTNPAPGSYNPDRAEKITRPKTAHPKFDKSPARARPNAFERDDPRIGPGEYDDGQRWNSNVKPVTIGVKRPKRVEKDQRNYSPERAEAITKTKVATFTMG